MQLLCKAAAFVGIENNNCQNRQNISLHEQNFVQHIEKYGLRFGTKEEYEFRFQLYQQKDAEIKQINSRHDSFKVGHNMFSTMTQFEAKKYNGLKIQTSFQEQEPAYLHDYNIPASIDWREKGAVNPVRNQGKCGSCWAFAATAAIEGAYFIKYGELLELSEQQFVDCDEKSNGCDGGYASNAFLYAQSHPQEPRSQYPYTATTQTCQASKYLGVVYTNGYTAVPTQSATQLLAAIEKQPVSVSVDASSTIFHQYKSGIINSEECGTNLDHGITAVGFGTDKDSGQYYYIVRNSWGDQWGEEGYVKIAAVDGTDGICGIQVRPVYPSVQRAYSQQLIQ